MRIFFVGGGKMATALAAGIVRQGLYRAEELCGCDVSESARAAFTAATGVVCEADASRCGEAETVLLAVKPQVAESAVASLPALRPGALVISICAGIPLSRLSGWFGGLTNIIRVMPNTPLMVGKGASCYALGSGVSEAGGELAGRLLGSLGMAHRVEESQLDAVTALSGSGPAYFFEMVKALTEAGKAVGLSEELSLELSVQTMVGAGEMLARGLGTPDELRDAVTSPHGTTFEGLEVMRKADFRALMRRVVEAARDRSVELGQGR